MEYQNLIVTQEEALMEITINRPDQLNALNSETIHELHLALDAANTDNSVRVVVLTGSGEKAFVAGADIKEFYQYSIEDGKKLSAEGHKKLFDFVENMGKIVIAAVNGYALGGGLELAMSSHIRIASDNAMLGLPEVTLGVIPGYGGTQRLAQLVGKGKAFEMIASGGMMGAAEAKDWGLVNQVTEPAELLDVARKLASKIARNSPVAIESAIKSVNAGYSTGVNGYEVEIEEFGKCFGTEDFKEGTNAFVEKRKPSFPGK